MKRKQLKKLLSKKYVTDGELLKDVRDQLIIELPKLTKRRAFWTIFPYFIMLSFAMLFFVDFSRPAKRQADCLARPGAEINIVKTPQPTWDDYGLTPSPDHWRIPNPTGRSAHIFDISLNARTLPYKRTVIRALSQDLAGEARLDVLDPPLIVTCPTTLFLTPIDVPEEDVPVRAAVIRTCAIRIDGKSVPLNTFVDPHTHHGKLIIEIAPSYGQPRFEENLSKAFGRLVRFVSAALSTRTSE